jgi:hypothetical protein
MSMQSRTAVETKPGRAGSTPTLSSLWSGCLLAMAVAALLGVTPASAQTQTPTGAALQSVEVEGTEFKATFADGRVLRSRDLVGATLTIAAGDGVQRVRIDAVERDPDATVGEVWLHTFSTQNADGSWRNVCNPGPDGRRQGFPIAGRARGDAALDPAEATVFDITCTGGARGKCVRFGYLPWADQGYDRYNACVRMVRADYCGDGGGTTRDGMLIDMYDDQRIQTTDNDPGLEFEAGWSANGAVCVRRVRVKENVSLKTLVEMCPRLKGRVGDMCTEEKARSLGAWLFNRSKP